MKQDTLDWFAAVTLNPDMDYAHFSVQGYDDTNTIMLTPDKYKKFSQVQEIFSDANGKFNDELFNQKYNEALKTYNVFISGDIQNKYFRKYSGTIYNPNAKKVVNPSLRVKMVDNPFNTSYGLVGFNEESKPIESAREIAQRNKVYDSETKQVLDYTPNNFISSMFGEPLVEAKWTEAGKHIDSWGNEVYHNKGDWKLQNGKPYYETLGNQDSTGKNFLHWTDVVTDDGSMMNSIDFLDSDGLEKSITGQTIKTALSIGLLFVPVLGDVLMGFGVVKGLNDIFGTLTKAISETGNDYNKSDVWKFANSMDGFFSRFDRSQSDESLSKPWGYENMTNLVDDVFEQLKQQKWIAKSIARTPKQLAQNEERVLDKFVAKNKDLTLEKYGKTLENAIKDGDISKNFDEMKSLFGNIEDFKSLEKNTIRATKLGQEFGSQYMALIQTKDVYENLKQNNFDSNTVLAGTVAAGLGFVGIMKTDLGKVAYRMFEPTELQKALSPVITDAIKETAEAAGTKLKKEVATGTGKMKFIKNAYNKIIDNVKSIWDAKGEFGIKGYISDMLKEGTEEVSEELLQDAVMQGAKYYEEGIKSLPGYKSKNTYKFSESNPFDRYAMSFFGGVLGGAIFKGAEHIENYDKIRDSKSAETLSNDTMTKLVSSLVTFDLEKVEKEINRQLDDGVISDKLSTEITDDSKSSDDITFKPADDISKSQREIVRSNLIGFVRGVDAYITRENLKLTKNDVVNKALVKSAIANSISNNFTNLIYTEYLNEASAKTKLAIQMNGLEEGDAKSKLKQQIDIHTNNINNILSGANAGEYAEKIAFVNNPNLLKTFISPTVEIYSKSQFGKNYNTLSDSKRSAVDESYKKYMDSVENNLDVVKAYKMFKMFKETFQGKIGEFANSDFINNYKLVQSIVKPQENKLSEDEMNEWVKSFKGNLSNDEFIQKHNLNEPGIYYTEEQKNDLVNSTIKQAIEANPQLINLSKLTGNYDLLLGSNYLLNPFNKEESNNIVNKLNDVIKNNGRLDKYTSDMLQSYLDSVDYDLNTNKTTSDILKNIIPKGHTYNIDKLENDSFSKLVELYLSQTGVNEISSDELLSNKTSFADFADMITNNLEYTGESFNKVKELKELKSKLENILNSNKTLNDPVYKILSSISEELFGKDLFKLLKEEDINLKSAKVLDDYVIRDVFNKDELNGMLNVINIFRSITSAIHPNTDYTNTINSYREKHGLDPYIEFTDEQSEIVDKALANISLQINFLLTLSNINDSGKIPTDKKIWFETQKHLLLKLKSFAEDNNVNDDFKKLDIISDLNFNDDNLDNLNNLIKECELKIYEWYQELPDKSILFEGENPLMKLKSDSYLSDNINLVKNPSEIEYSDLLFKEWLLSNIVMNPKDFNNIYQKFLQQNDIKAPFYSQMLNVKIISSFAYDSEGYFNKFGKLNEIKGQSFAENLIYVDASSGSGKTTMIAPFIWNMLENSNKVNWLVSNNDVNIKNVTKNIKDISLENVKTKDELFKSILTSEEYDTYLKIKDLTFDYINDNIDTITYKSKYNQLLNNINKKEGLPNNILYDEAGHISAVERDIISKLGIKLFAMGDLTQDSYSFGDTVFDIDYQKQLLKTPKLPSGIRFDNINKRLSTLTLLEFAEQLNSLKENSQLPDSVINTTFNKLKTLIPSKEFKYYQQQNDILGDKVIKKEELFSNNKLSPEYELLVKSLVENKKGVAYISDEVNRNLEFENYLKNLGVDLVSSDAMQGEQYDYTIINVQFDAPSNDIDTYITNFKHFNTLVTRSINGNIIVNNNLPIYNSSSTIFKPVDVSITDEEASEYKNLWLNSYFNDNSIKEEVKRFEPTVSQEEETVIEDFKLNNTSKNSVSNNRYQEILNTKVKAESLLDPKVNFASKEEEQNEINKKISEVLANDGGYIVLENTLDNRTPYNEDGSVNGEYWLLNLMFFNPNYEDWNILINTYAPNQDIKNTLLNMVNSEKLKDANIHFLSNGEVRLEYIDNNGNEANIILEQHTIPFKESVIPFKDLVVEFNKVTFDRSTSLELNNKQLEDNSANKIKISNTLYAGKINGNEGVYAFGTYNLWNREQNLGVSYINNRDGHASAIMVNPIGRTFSKFVNEWKKSKSSTAIDRLCGINQSYRLIKALVDYNGDSLYKQELSSFLNDVKQDVDFSLDLDISNNDENIFIKSKTGKVDVLTNIFDGESNISLFAKNNKLFKEINSYLKANGDINFDQLVGLFTKIKSVLNNKDNLDSIPEELTNIKKEVKNLLDIVNPDSEILRNVNTLLDDVLYGISLLTENSNEDFIKYFNTDLYFSFYHNIKAMNSIIKHLTKTLNDSKEKVYENLYNTLDKLTDSSKNEHAGLFKDGIWYNYVALKSDESVIKAKKSGNLYSSYKDISSVYFDNQIKSPTLYIKVGQNQMNEHETKPLLEVKKFTFKDLQALSNEMLNKVSGENLLNLVGNKIDINSEQDKNLYDFLTSKIIKKGEEFVTLQLDENNKLTLSKNIKDTVTNFINNEGGSLGEDGRLYKENAIYKVVPKKGVIFFKYNLDNNFNFMKKDLSELDLINKEWDSYKDVLSDKDVDKDLLISSTKTILQSLSDESKLEIKTNLDEFRNGTYTIDGLKVDNNQRTIIADIIEMNDNYTCKNI